MLPEQKKVAGFFCGLAGSVLGWMSLIAPRMDMISLAIALLGIALYLLGQSAGDDFDGYV
jgi:hypothetical protein